MSIRKIKDAKDLSDGSLVYFKGHAKATYMSDGTTVEDAINNIEVGTGGDLSNYATKEYVDEEIKNIVDNAPESLNTLNKLATVTNTNKESIESLNSAIINKVDKSYVDENFQSKGDYLTKTEASGTYQSKGSYVTTSTYNQTVQFVQSSLNSKQSTLKSGQNIKTINGESILGSGDISISSIKWSILKKGSNINVGDIAYWDGNMVKTVPLSNWGTSLGTPVGVVVIPDNFLPDGRARIVSLVNMAHAWGDQFDWYLNELGNDDTPLTNFQAVPITNNNGAITGNEIYGYLPSDNYSSTISYDDPLSRYSSLSQYSFRVPSPYLGDKGLNPSYSDSSFANALSDFNGLSNTEILFNFVPTNGGTFGAACACYEYKDSAGSNLQWYLPSLGELGFLIARLRTITSSITAVGGIEFTNSIDVGYWSSTEILSSNAWGVFIHDGLVATPMSESSFGYTRAFALI